jgi:hypothetical protein
MTEVPAQSELRPSRRAVVRAGVWTVPVVSIVSVAPAFAVSAKATLTGSGFAEKWGTGQTKHVSWDLNLTNGAAAIDTISIAFTYAPSGGGSFTSFAIVGFAPSDNSWTFPPIPPGGSATVTATHTAEIAANSTINIHTDFAGTDNSSGTVSALATVRFVGSPATFQISAGTVTWGPGGEHTH